MAPSGATATNPGCVRVGSGSRTCGSASGTAANRSRKVHGSPTLFPASRLVRTRPPSGVRVVTTVTRTGPV